MKKTLSLIVAVALVLSAFCTLFVSAEGSANAEADAVVELIKKDLGL